MGSPPQLGRPLISHPTVNLSAGTDPDSADNLHISLRAEKHKGETRIAPLPFWYHPSSNANELRALPAAACCATGGWLLASKQDVSEDRMKTQGEVEATICEGITRFEQNYMGRGPKDIHTHVIGDLVIVRLKGVLTVAEQQLVKALAPEKGRDLLKQVRTHLIETARPVMEAMVEEVTGVKVMSLHHDISTTTGEEIVIFTLAAAPHYRDAKKLSDS
jgi:uncharacterized protein YbcI